MKKMSPAAIRRTRRALLAFYDARRRPLPWRESREPYAVWISEVMLQQTRVESVLPYYRRWMERFPDVGALADAPLEDVLKLWEGLGYYARARNLRQAAAVVRDRMGGELPRASADLRSLPGVGEYTAGAVASIAFGERVPAVDGNVRRVLARLMDEPVPSAAWLRARATELVDPRRPGDLNQALMELGATVCTARAPRCERCPIARECAARSAGTAAERPRPRRRAPVPEVEYGVAVLVRERDGRRELLLARRPDDGLLGGLWELPSAPVGRARSARAAALAAARSAGVAPSRTVTALSAVPHGYSHFRGIYRPFLWEVSGPEVAGRGGDRGRPYEWVDRATLAARALPVALRKIADGVAASHL